MTKYPVKPPNDDDAFGHFNPDTLPDITGDEMPVDGWEDIDHQATS